MARQEKTSKSKAPDARRKKAGGAGGKAGKTGKAGAKPPGKAGAASRGKAGPRPAGTGAVRPAGAAARNKEAAASGAGKAAPGAVKSKTMSKAIKARTDKLKTMLEERRREILESIRKAREDSVEAHRQTFSEVGDLVTASVEKEMAFKYGEQGVNMLREIDSALEKLKEGNYGICEACGKLIGVKRLEVVPSARLCIACKAKEEGGGAGGS